MAGVTVLVALVRKVFVESGQQAARALGLLLILTVQLIFAMRSTCYRLGHMIVMDRTSSKLAATNV